LLPCAHPSIVPHTIVTICQPVGCSLALPVPASSITGSLLGSVFIQKEVKENVGYAEVERLRLGGSRGFE
jgi:hypothetical protein